MKVGCYMINHDIEYIIENGELFIDKLKMDKNDRYWSWEHCYSEFAYCKLSKLTDKEIDYLCLHLAFYLASWGMYRGSSKLLQKDYKVHANVVRELMKKEYADLWALTCKDLISDNNKLELLFILSDILRENYCNVGVTPTDTLITKILMGTLGCVPAYDRYFIDGVKGRKGAYFKFNKQSIQELSNFYVKHYNTFEKWRQSLSIGGIEYPQMKVLDMCFLSMGYKIEAMWHKKLENKNE